MIYLICSASAISLVWTAIKRVDHHSIKFTKVTGVESVSGKGEGGKNSRFWAISLHPSIIVVLENQGSLFFVVA